MEIEQESGCKGIKRRKPLKLDWQELDPMSSGDDDRPPDIVVMPKKEFKDGCSGEDAKDNKKEDLELLVKSDADLEQFIVRNKTKLPQLSAKLNDKGEKLKENIRRHEEELERRQKIRSEKGDKKCEETIHLSDNGDEGSSCSEKKCSSASMFAKSFNKKLEENKDSRTVSAFKNDLSFINHCQGRKSNPNSQLLGKAKSRMVLSSRPAAREPAQAPITLLVDDEKHIISNNDEKDGDSTTPSRDCLAGNKRCSFSHLKDFHKEQPSRSLRPRHRRDYHLVDEDPSVQLVIQYEELGDCMKDVKVHYPSRDDPRSVEVIYTDMACLAPEACLSSTIMNFYIRYLQQSTSLLEHATCNYHFFNTYFYNKLQKLSYKEDSFLKFRKWWKGVNIFEKAYILLPVHENVHWSLVIICLPANKNELGPILLHLDSLGMHDSKVLFDNIKRFLIEEWSYLRRSEAPLNLHITDEIWENLDRRITNRKVMVPQQMNEYDCGLFVLFYMERFIHEAPERLKKKDLSMFSKNWFHHEEASNLRVTIHNLLVKEFKNAKENESVVDLVKESDAASLDVYPLSKVS